MEVTFYGATREVTGSAHLVKFGASGILLDCGMFQGRRKESAEKNKKFPFKSEMVTNIILSHAHIDHAGRLPLMNREGFNGRIICTRATADISKYLLEDSARIQESDATYLNYKTARSHLYKINKISNKNKKKAEKIKNILKPTGQKLNIEAIKKVLSEHNLERIEPLYSVEDVRQTLSCIEAYPYRHPIIIGKDAEIFFYEAGHVLGSAISVLRVKENGVEKRICYTGDLGRSDKPILKDPASEFEEKDKNIDLLIMESTYGNRVHEKTEDIKTKLKQAVTDAYNNGGTLLIPAFAFGRTQEIIYVLHQMYDEGTVPKLPIFVDSPLGTGLTKVFGEHPEVYDKETHETFLEQNENPFSFKEINFTRSVVESMELMREEKPHIVISSSGMCEAGRILHHLRYKIHNEKNTILIVGYMAANTFGRHILDKGLEFENRGRTGEAPVLNFFNKSYPLRAKVVQIGGFSAHADKAELISFLKKSNLNVKKIAVVHGEENSALSFADKLKENGYDAFVPYFKDSVKI